MAYLPIGNYGVIGDLHTVALVGINGAIDWLCFPSFNSPSVFAALLDDDKGGRFQIAPAADDVTAKQMYMPDTNVLVTRFLSDHGMAEITDFMPVESETDDVWDHRIIRRVAVIRGEFRFRMRCQPAFDYARTNHRTEAVDGGVIFRSRDLNLGLVSDRPLTIDGNAAMGEFVLHAHETATFVLYRVAEGDATIRAPDAKAAEAVLGETVRFWRDWLAQCTYQGRWREMVHRSALVLKLLTFAPTGAIVAAPTTSLPEAIGGERNWDYRYTWIRDASFTCYALLSLGFEMEAGRFMQWVAARCRELDPTKGGLQTVYGIDGQHDLEEYTLDHLAGYRNSRPVRVGNGAYQQLQLDIYGELMDAMYLYNQYGQLLSYHQWTYLRELMNWLCRNWQQSDDGLWEVRSGRQPFVFLRVMTWVALDRALRIARQRGLPAHIDLWERTRDDVYEEIVTRGWNEERKSFVQSYGSDALDASNLLMPIVKFMGPTDPLFVKTLDRTLEELTYGSLVYRYDTGKGASDGLTGREGTFSLCSFWLVESLTQAGRLDEARATLERMFTYANHLGLYAEEIGASGEMLGNYPQAFTHLGVINAAVNLDHALKSK